MTKREKILLSSLALVAAAVVFFFYSAMARDRITAARAAIARYRKAEAAIPSGQGDRETLEQEIAELKGATTAASAQADLGQSEIATLVKRGLGAHGIEPARLQTATSGGVETVEFLLECDSYAFFSFLKSLPDPGHHWRYSLVSVKSLPSGKAVSATLRLAHE